jgi:NADH dehydrogenase
MPRVFLTGATGFVGRAVVAALRGHGHTVRCLVRRGSESDLQGLGAIERVVGDILSLETLLEGMAGCAAAIHLVGIIREVPARGVTFERIHVEGTRNVLAAATASGIRRYLHMSALGTRADARSRYHQTKWEAEEAVRAQPLAWTIFRPSVIYGPGDGLVTLLTRLVRLPVVPVVGSGRQRLQPVPVAHVAEGFARALEREAAVKQTYDVGGPDVVPMLELLDRIGAALGRRNPPKVHIPLGLMQPLAHAFHRLPGFPVTPDQLLMLEEDNVCDPRPFYVAFDLSPTPLSQGLAGLLA